MRWAMMLRWISELPPAIVFANDMKKPCDQRPDFGERVVGHAAPSGPTISMPSSYAALPASDVAIFM